MGLAEGLFPLLFVITSLIYFVLSVPAGRLADRVGRGRLLLGGYALLPLVYLTLLLPTVDYLALCVCLVLFGAYYAATDGVLMALASTVLPPDVRTSGLGLLTTATSVAGMLASLVFGAFWNWWSMEAAVVAFVVGNLIAVGLAAVALASLNRADDPAPSRVA
jgi:MFS family permease